jgi:glycosyltransferase involved in cell wall biosynthesis
MNGGPSNGSRPKLVLISGRDPLRTSGGSESYVTGHARAAILAGYEPHIFSIAPRSEVLETEFGFLHRVASPVRPARSITSILQRPFLVPAVSRFVRDLPGTLIVHGYGAWADTVVEVCSRAGPRAVAVATVFMAIEHETTAKLTSTVVRESRLWRLLHEIELAWVRRVTAPVEGRAYRALRALIVNYDSVTRMLVRRYGSGLPIRHLTYSPPTAFDDPPAPAPLPEPLQGFGDPQAPLIVSVSRHDGRKGLDVLIRALLALRQQGIPFRACLVGPGLLLSAHRRWVASLGLDSQVLIPGRVPDVMPYLQHSDVYVLPSREEGSGSVAVLEALQAGAAIVSSDVDGLPEDLTDQHDALLVPGGEEIPLRGAILRLIGEPELRLRLSRAARETYERRFAAPVLAAQLCELYTELGLPPGV